MQNLVRISGKALLFACLSFVLFTGCSQKTKLKLAIEVANKQCPISTGAAGEMTSIEFDGTDVVYNLAMNEEYVNLDALEKDPESMKSAISVMFNNPMGGVKELLELVIANRSGMKFVYKGKNSGKEVSCHLGTEELKQLLKFDVSQEDSNRRKLEEMVKVSNISCPMAIDETTTLDKLVIEPDNVVYDYTIDEQKISMDELTANIAQMKQNIKASLNVSDPSLRTFLEVCVKNNKGLVYRYKGNTSGKQMEDIVFDVSEIKALF